jgi:hypothetical protein
MKTPRGDQLFERTKTLKVMESQERYRYEISPDRFRGAETGESAKNAEAGTWRECNPAISGSPIPQALKGSKSPGGLSASFEWTIGSAHALPDVRSMR